MLRYFVSIELHKLSNYVNRFIDSNIKSNYNYPISGVNGWILRFIANQEKHGKDAFQKDLEREFGITRSTASKVILLMEEKGYVVSERMPEDIRRKRLHVTPKAREAHDGMREQMFLMEGKLLKGFTEQEIAQLTDYLLRMEKNMSEETQE
jgi:MarR family transcriptional regulator, repressor for mepA